MLPRLDEAHDCVARLEAFDDALALVDRALVRLVVLAEVLAVADFAPVRLLCAFIDALALVDRALARLVVLAEVLAVADFAFVRPAAFAVAERDVVRFSALVAALADVRALVRLVVLLLLALLPRAEFSIAILLSFAVVTRPQY